MQHFCKTVVTLTASLAVITCAIIADAQDLKTSQEVMDFASSKMATYKTWSADYSQNMKVLGNAVAMSGQVVQKPPHRMWMQIEMPMMGQQTHMTMVMGQDGIMWQSVEVGTQRQFMKMDMNQLGSNAMASAGMKGSPLDEFDPRKQLETTREVCDFSVGKATQLDGQTMYVLNGTWKPGVLTNREIAAAAALVGKTRVFIGQTDGFVHRLEQFDKSQTNVIVAMEFKNMKFNQDVPDDKFIFKPPADAHVVDITPMAKARMNVQQEGDGTPPKDKPPTPLPPATKPPSATK